MRLSTLRTVFPRPPILSIELIDRLLREAFDPGTVLGWVDANLPGDANLVWIDALCAATDKAR